MMTSPAVTTDAAVPQRRRRLRWLRIGSVVAAVLVVLALLFLAGGGWYFSGQIRADGLAVPADITEPYNLTVVAMAGDSVTLSETDKDSGAKENPSLRKRARYGLAWPTGYGELADQVTVTPGGVQRELRVVTGTPPVPTQPARLDRDVFLDPRGSFGYPAEDVTFPCPPGSCPAWLVPGSRTTWAVLVHGKGGTRQEPLRTLPTAVDAGMPALVIGYRNDPGAPRDPSGTYRYGSTEWRDLEAAVRFAQDRGAQDVVLYGYSMGGAIVASFLEHSTLAGQVRAVVLDAPMLDFSQTVKHGAAQRSLPVVGLPIPPPLTWTALRIAGLRYDIDWPSINYLDGEWLRVPTLIIHGTEDLTVPVTTSDALAARHPQLVRMVRVTGAAHVESWNVDRGGYETEVRSFLDDALRGGGGG